MQKPLSVVFDDLHCALHENNTKIVIGFAEQKGGLYMMKYGSYANKARASDLSDISFRTWHDYCNES